MPADPSHTRRVSRRTATDEETDVSVRRARGEISCAECRRLKLKCDKKLPCSSCTRRGCPSICPNGSLSTGQGTRFVLADTAQLHAKIGEMGQRIRQLEDALAIFQSGVSSETHPLLRDELLSIKFGPDKGHALEREESSQEPLVNSIDALGTLTIGDRGEVKYFGRSAGSETLFLAGAELDMTSVESDESPQLSLEIARLSNAFPFGAEGNVDRAMDLLFSHLPSQPRAWSLCETYMEHAAWVFRPLKRDEIVNDVLSPIYKAQKERKVSGSACSFNISSHKLAVLFLVFALGALVDLTLEPYNTESETFYHLSRACLSLRSVFDSPEITTVQAVVLMAAYHGMGGKKYTMDSSWALISLGAKLAQSIGLHRDSARFNMDPQTVQRRRGLFWELFSAELFHSLAIGRPPSIRLSYIDCEFPIDDEATLDKDGRTRVGYYRWKYEFTKEIFSTVTELTLTAEPPRYQTVLELDRKVREKTLPSHLNVFMSPEDEHCTPSVYMRGCLLGQYRSVTLLYIHRSFFAQAMLDHPVNPLRSPYAPSFLAAYRCASGVIKSNLNHFDRFPDLCCRWYNIWTHLFSAAIIVGCIVTRSPSSSMASSAFIELGLACDLFEKGAVHSRRARSGLALLRKLRQKAFQVYSQFRSGNSPPTVILSVGKPDYGDDELALFGGQTRVLVSKLLSNRSKNRSATPQSSILSPIDTESKPLLSENAPDVHPSLVEYLSMFPIDNSNANLQPPSALFPHETSASIFSPQGHMTGSEFQQIPSPWETSPSVLINSSNSPSSYRDDPPLFTHPISAPGDPTTQYGNIINQNSPPESNLTDLGMMMTGDSGMDEHWMSFMRDSGLLEGNMNHSGLYGGSA
ncbi:fungal-specific transcription factor domain-containing protein [Collybia nuda]|uniref:Fungal-specific transcription factor domain-containing protein n=1 Tax=Collybia nuda TaxID=64659 RepID=A0A9P5YK73_9AGAR|nr:fungal-specific transcription factor domain-containing protein [Collybia nuda]